MPEAYYVSDDWLYLILDSSRDCIFALFPQSGVSNPTGAGIASVWV